MKLPFRHSFGGKILGASLLTTVVALGLVALVFYQHDSDTFRRQLGEKLEAQARVLGSGYAPALDFEIKTRDLEESLALVLAADRNTEVAALYLRDGSFFVGHAVEGATPYPSRVTPGERYEQPLRLSVLHEVWKDGERIGFVFLRGTLDELARRREQYALLLLGVNGLAVLVALLVSSRLQRVLLRPINELVETADDVTRREDYSRRARRLSADELGHLTDAFNRMLHSIEGRDRALKGSEEQVRTLNRRLQEKNEELESIIYVTSHDLRSPLVNIQGFGRELERSCDELLREVRETLGPKVDLVRLLDEDIPEALHHIQVSAAKMGRLLKGLLRLSRLDRGELAHSEIDMNALLEGIATALEFQAQDADVTIDVGDLPPCTGDAVMIEQVFTNLLDNAIKYASPDRPGIVHVRGHLEDEQACYTVRDNGIGVPESLQERVFEVFQRMDPTVCEGEGLGLTIAQRIVGRHGGRIRLESEAGQGTVIHVTLPAAVAAATRGRGSRA